jgi:hypothetical protein
MFVRWDGQARDEEKYLEARRLREEDALPFKQIASQLDVSVSTAFLWTKDIVLDPESIDRNLYGPTGPLNREHVAARVATWRKKNRERRLSYQEAGRARARQGDSHHMAGCMLYWAEGSKERNAAKLCNSDVHMMRYFRRFLTACFDVPPEKLKLRLHVYLGNGLSIEEIEDYWLAELELSRSALRKHSINPLPTSSSGMKKNRLPFGVATLTVNSTEIVQHIFGAIQEYAGFDEPRWLDCDPVSSEEAASN